jgi:hypothetical protein
MRAKLFVGSVFLIVFSLLAVGCKSNNMSMGSDSAPKSAILMNHDGHQVIFTVGQGGQIIAYTDGKVEHCAQCEADVKAYYMTGHIDSVCKMCGATRTVIPYDPSLGHQ